MAEVIDSAYIAYENDDILKMKLNVYNKRLVESRKILGFSQKDMALLTGLQVPTISAIETLKLIPNDDIKSEFADALNKSVSYLFPNSLYNLVETGVFDKRVVTMNEEAILNLPPNKLKLLISSEPKESDYEVEELDYILTTLTPTEERVIRLRWGLDGTGISKTLRQIGEEFGCTGANIERIEKRALRRLRHPSRSQILLGKRKGHFKTPRKPDWKDRVKSPKKQRKPYQCPICNEILSQRLTFDHIVVTHPEYEIKRRSKHDDNWGWMDDVNFEPGFICGKCGRAVTLKGLKNHVCQHPTIYELDAQYEREQREAEGNLKVTEDDKKARQVKSWEAFIEMIKKG